MNECKKCGRPLGPDEKNLCPACKRKKVETGKRVVKGAGTALGVAAGVVAAVLTGGKGVKG